MSLMCRLITLDSSSHMGVLLHMVLLLLVPWILFGVFVGDKCPRLFAGKSLGAWVGPFVSRGFVQW